MIKKNTCLREEAFALKDASRNSASFLSFLIFSRSEQAAFNCSFPEVELDICNSWSNFSSLIKASSTLSNAYDQCKCHCIIRIKGHSKGSGATMAMDLEIHYAG